MVKVIAGAFANTAATTDKASITTGTNSVTVQVRLAGKPTSDPTNFLYNDGTVTNSVPRVIPANSKVDIYTGVGNQVTIVGANGTFTEVGTASSANSGVYD